MAKVTHVKKAQQRYKTIPVLDADGNPVRTPVMRADGTQKKTKTGKPVFMVKTVSDKDQPLEPHVCDHCRKPIEVGTPYKHISPKSGPYGGTQRNRHESCPDWQVWEYSSSLSARIEQIQHDFSERVSEVETADDATELLEGIASDIRELAEEKRESASNIEDGFGHPTTASEELNETADTLESWADDIESTDVEDPVCEECDGTGKLDCEDCSSKGTSTCPVCDGEPDDDPDELCEECSGTGKVDCEECDQGQADCSVCDGEETDFESWREGLGSEVDNCPI